MLIMHGSLVSMNLTVAPHPRVELSPTKRIFAELVTPFVMKLLPDYQILGAAQADSKRENASEKFDTETAIFNGFSVRPL
jgi:hypothetical protein